MYKFLLSMLAVIYTVFVLWLGLGVWKRGQQDSVGSSMSEDIIVLAINDVYRIDGVDKGRYGALSRLRTLRRELEQTHGPVLLLHAGDFLSPSLLSRTFKGQAMVDVMNLLDGIDDPYQIDQHFFVTFGNHEFDDSDCNSPDHLKQRVAESQFRWFGTNIDFDGCVNGIPMLSSDKVLDSALVNIKGTKIGLFGLTIALEPADKKPPIQSYVKTAEAATARLRSQGADIVIALTHLNIEDDEALLEAFESDPLKGPDLIVGGHDHRRMVVPDVGSRIFKSDADALSVSKFTIRRELLSAPSVSHEFIPLNYRTPPDPLVHSVVQYWLGHHAERYCASMGRADDCLEEILGLTTTTLVGDELENRSTETALGNWVADTMRGFSGIAGAAAGPPTLGYAGNDRPEPAPGIPGGDVSLINSGTLRLNYTLPEGSTIRRRQVEELVGFPTQLVRIEVPGSQVWSAVQHAMAQADNGGWSHIAGLAIKPDGNQFRVKLKKADGTTIEIAENSAEPVTVITTAFVACFGGDGFAFSVPDCASKRIVQFASDGTKKPLLLNELLAISLKPGGMPGTINPALNGRLCLSADACLFDSF